jgi:hypothetical protein
MPSQSQLDANRNNALLSTGPRTPEGKAASSRNALKHGLLARDAVLLEEDKPAFLQLLATFQAAHQPVGPLEEFLVCQMAAAQWRLARVNRIETGLIATRLEQSRHSLRHTYADEQPFGQAQPAPGHDQAPDSDPAAADYYQTTRLLGLSFHLDTCGADSFCKLCRYENTIRRAFYKALSALQSAQARRLGQPPPRMPK